MSRVALKVQMHHTSPINIYLQKRDNMQQAIFITPQIQPGSIDCNAKSKLPHIVDLYAFSSEDPEAAKRPWLLYTNGVYDKRLPAYASELDAACKQREIFQNINSNFVPLTPISEQASRFQCPLCDPAEGNHQPCERRRAAACTEFLPSW